MITIIQLIRTIITKSIKQIFK